MLTKVEVRSAQGNVLVLPLDDISNGVIVAEITGLDPVKATLASSSFAGLDGEQYQSASRDKRNIVMTLELDPDPAVESVRSLRNRLYSFFMTKSEVFLRFFTEDGLEVDIQGRVESCETSIFTANPALDISIVCFDPDFYDQDPVVINTTTTQGTYETPVPYSGSVETGLVFSMTVPRNLSEFTIYHRIPGGQLYQLDFRSPLLTGDKLTISTVRGDKYANLTRTGTTTSIIFGVSPQSRWFELVPGENTFMITDPGSLIPYSITYNTRYGAL